MARWIIRNAKANIEKMSLEFGISKIFATVLANKDILTRRALDTYLYKDERLFLNSLDMKDMKNAVLSIIEAISRKEKICIYGDYDVDGVTSTTILYKAMKKIGANVIYYIPDREEEGYGLNIEAIDELKAKGVDIILTCDNGIASIEEVYHIRQSDMQIIIIDHHEPRFFEQDGEKIEVVPDANYIVNPKQRECPYPFKNLSAGGLCFKFIKELYEYMEVDFSLDEYLVFASISTVCDIVDLLDENRLIVKMGLDIINKNKKINLGLYELLKLNQIEDKEIDEYDYGFVIGPCINACGRLETALTAVKLFISEDEEELKELAKELYELNSSRKELTKNAVDELLDYVENSSIKDDNVLVIYNENIHESIAGIVAGKIKERYYKPTFVITKAKDGAKGSGRSIPPYDMFSEMIKCSSLFTRFGGHKMAGGLSLSLDNIDKFREEINKNSSLTKEDLEETLVIDKALSFLDIDINLAKELERMKPFGKENRQPLFATKNVVIKNIRFVGKNSDILQLDLYRDNRMLKAISFDGYKKFINILEENISKEEFENILNGKQKYIDLNFDILYSIEVNKFNGYENIQLILKDFRLS